LKTKGRGHEEGRLEGRVGKFAKMMDAETIDDWLKKQGRTWNPAGNEKFIEAMKKEGREIHDIGPDFARRAGGDPPSEIYARELEQLAGYNNYTSWFGPGGVPGFDK
jgi:hypothetical protein